MKKLYWKKFISALIFGGSGLFTLFFFSPLEVYLGNPSEFHVYADNAILILLAFAALCTLVWTAAVSFLPTKVLKFVNLGVFAVTLCFYVQALALNGELIRLDGEQLLLSRATKITNGLVWLGILALVFLSWYVAKRLRKEKPFINVTKVLAVILAVMQLTGVASLYFTYDKSVNTSKAMYFSNQQELSLSGQKNVVYFVIDYCDGLIAQDALAQDPELFKEFTGFTYYPDASFTHSRTYPAITYLLSGQKCYFDKPYTQYADEVFQKDSFMAGIDSLGADIRIFTDTRYVGPSAKEYVDNYKTVHATSLSSVKPLGFLLQTWKVSCFRGAPYGAKNLFAYTPGEVNEASVAYQTDRAKVNDDLAFYQSVQTEGVSVNSEFSSAFRFYHMFGSHPGAVINEDAEYQENVTLTQALRGDIKVISAYLKELKDKGLYENTTVIITADHGHVSTKFSSPQTCIMLVKMAGDNSEEPVRVSSAPVCHEDLFATVIKGLGGDYSSYGKAIDEISETEARVRYHYNTVIDAEKNQEILLDEYEITGDARDINNYRPTGKQWIIYYTV
jgi:hypothetical protein